jgi:DNA (cytosine-5)-methyltransferase 1
MKHGSLFSGIGGFDLAAQWMGWENVFHCEWMEFPRKVLEYYFPNADSLIDICKTDFKKYANTIDILTGGFPCQPFSMAGKRKGTDDERYLWGEMLRAVQEIKPQFVIAENVFGITNIDGGLVFEQVCLDLETEGYEVQPFIIPACAKNAPHRRDRVWFVAYRISKGLEGCTSKRIQTVKGGKNGFQDGISSGNVHDGFIANTNGTRVQGQSINTRTSKEIRQGWQSFTQTWNKWNIGRWQEFPTEPPICGGNDGLPTKLDGITLSKWRAESIKGYGNAIVPQVAYEIFKQLESFCNIDIRE